MALTPDDDAVALLVEAVDAVGLRAEVVVHDAVAAHLVVINPAGGQALVDVKRLSLASSEGLDRQIRRWGGPPSPGGHARVLVADRVTREAREILRASHWGWLDLRGHLRILAQGIYVDTDVPALRATSGPPALLEGRVSKEVATLLLLDPAESASVRQMARKLGRAPSSVSQALASMRTTALVDEHGRPALPDLFWALAERWKPSQEDVQSVPSPANQPIRGSVNDVLRLGLEDVTKTTGWALTDTMAAARYGAPVSVRSDYPFDFYVPDQATLRRAVHLLGPVRNHNHRAATVRVPPVGMVCSTRVDVPNETWPLAQPLFVALDLAQDPDRGREVLQGWTPKNVGHRVW